MVRFGPAFIFFGNVGGQCEAVLPFIVCFVGRHDVGNCIQRFNRSRVFKRVLIPD